MRHLHATVDDDRAGEGLHVARCPPRGVRALHPKPSTCRLVGARRAVRRRRLHRREPRTPIRDFAKEASAVAEIERVVHRRVDGDLAAIRPERQKLVEQIGRTSARVRALSDEVEGAAGKSHHAHAALLDRLEQAARSLQDMQKDLSRSEREVNAQEAARAEADWVVRTLSDFERMWALMTPENRGRLVDALIDRVVVDDRSGAVSVRLAVLSRPLPQRATPAEALA